MLQGNLDPREKWEPGEIRDREEWLGRMDCLDPGDYRGRKVEQGTKGHRDHRESKESKDWRGRWDPRVYREHQVCQDSQDSREPLGFLGTRVLLVDRETLDPPERTVRMEWMVGQDCLDPLVIEARLGRMVVRGYKVWRDPWVP